MKKIFIILITCFLLTGCVLPTRTKIIGSRIQSNVIEMDFGTYSIPSTWTKRDDHSTSSKYFFTNKNDKKNPPNNISVEMGRNYYSEDESLKFKDAINRQVAMQAKAYNMTLNASGSTSKNGYTVFTFKLEGKGQITIQHYIVGDHKYVLVHETIWDDNTSDTDYAAKTIVDSFKWKK